MAQSFIIMLIRQINGLLSADSGELPDTVSGLSISQVHLLGELYELEERGRLPMSLSALAQETGFSKAATCAALKGLRKAGYIRVWIDRADNRRKEIALTGQAQAVKEEVAGYISARSRSLCAGIPETELQNLERCLQVVLQNARDARLEAHAAGRIIS